VWQTLANCSNEGAAGNSADGMMPWHRVARLKFGKQVMHAWTLSTRASLRLSMLHGSALDWHREGKLIDDKHHQGVCAEAGE
jgi:hypothetical protein